MESHFTSLQSELIGFTPEPAFNSGTNSIFINPDLHSIFFYIKSDDGFLVTLDNSGIVGRTEIKIATVRVRVGPPIPQDDGIGDPDPAAVFWVDLSTNPPPGVRNASIYLGPSGTNNVGQLFLGGIQPSTYKILEAPDPEPTPQPTPSDPGTFVLEQIKKYKQFSGIVYPNILCTGPVGALCKGSAQLFTIQKVDGKNKKTVYGKCTFFDTSAPNGTYCEMKLKKAAKTLLNSDGKFKATLAVTSTGISTQSTLKVTIKK